MQTLLQNQSARHFGLRRPPWFVRERIGLFSAIQSGDFRTQAHCAWVWRPPPLLCNTKLPTCRFLSLKSFLLKRNTYTNDRLTAIVCGRAKEGAKQKRVALLFHSAPPLVYARKIGLFECNSIEWFPYLKRLYLFFRKNWLKILLTKFCWFSVIPE